MATELQVLEGGPERALPGAREQARDHADALVGELRDQRPQVAGLHADVGVADDVDLPGRLPLEPDELRDLGIDGHLAVGEHHARVEARVPGHEAPGHRVRGVVRGRDTEEDLERGVVDAGERLEVRLQIVIAAGQRLEDRDARRPIDWPARRLPAGPHAPREEQHHRPVQRQGRGRQRDREVH